MVLKVYPPVTLPQQYISDGIRPENNVPSSGTWMAVCFPFQKHAAFTLSLTTPSHRFESIFKKGEKKSTWTITTLLFTFCTPPPGGKAKQCPPPCLYPVWNPLGRWAHSHFAHKCIITGLLGVPVCVQFPDTFRGRTQYTLVMDTSFTVLEPLIGNNSQ